MTNDIEKLFKAGETEPWIIFRDLADAYEEAGELTLSKGFRWLYNWERWPIKYCKSGKWQWEWEHSEAFFVKMGPDNKIIRNNEILAFRYLPEDIFNEDRHSHISDSWKEIVLWAAYRIATIHLKYIREED